MKKKINKVDGVFKKKERLLWTSNFIKKCKKF